MLIAVTVLYCWLFSSCCCTEHIFYDIRNESEYVRDAEGIRKREGSLQLNWNMKLHFLLLDLITFHSCFWRLNSVKINILTCLLEGLNMLYFNIFIYFILPCITANKPTPGTFYSYVEWASSRVPPRFKWQWWWCQHWRSSRSWKWSYELHSSNTAGKRSYRKGEPFFSEVLLDCCWRVLTLVPA